MMHASLRTIVTQDLPQPLEIAWEALQSTHPLGALFSSYQFCLGEAKGSGHYPTFFLAFDGEDLWGGLTADLRPVTTRPVLNIDAVLAAIPQSSLAAGIGDWKPPRAYGPSVMITSRAGQATDIRFRSGLSDEERGKVLDSLVSALERYARSYRAGSVVFRFISTASRDVCDFLHDAGYSSAAVGVRTYLPIEFQSFNEYLGLLRKRRRHVIRRQRQRALHDRHVQFTTRDLEDAIDDHIRFSVYNAQKYKGGLSADAFRARYEHLAKTFPGCTYVTQMAYRGEIIASILFIRYRDGLFPRYVGVHPDAPLDLAPYFQVYFYRGIELALDLGVRFIDCGQELYEAKIERGCMVDRKRIFVRAPEEYVRSRLLDLDAASLTRIRQFEAKVIRTYRRSEYSDSDLCIAN